jgi:photosystem II stability/assembly factor-like uncharacterized protein
MKQNISLAVPTVLSFLLLMTISAKGVERLTAKQDDTSYQDATKVYFVDATRGWILAQTKGKSLILRTTDGGEHWAVRYGSTDAAFLSVKFITGELGWVVGSNGTILHTSDGGATWEKQASETTAALTGLSVIDANTAWVSGPVGTLLFTADGGKIWSARTVNTPAALSDVMFADRQRGWAVGYGTILSTTDGGNTWKMKNSGDWKPLSSIYFANKETGWITVGPVILQTTNEGQGWKEIVPPSQGKVVGLSFVDSRHGWVAKSRAEEGSIVHVTGHDKLSSESFILYTSDGGTTWREQLHLKNDEGHGALLLNIFFINQLRGWAVGRQGLLMRTIDGGRTWTRLESPLRNL